MLGETRGRAFGGLGVLRGKDPGDPGERPDQAHGDSWPRRVRAPPLRASRDAQVHNKPQFPMDHQSGHEPWGEASPTCHGHSCPRWWRAVAVPSPQPCPLPRCLVPIFSLSRLRITISPGSGLPRTLSHYRVLSELETPRLHSVTPCTDGQHYSALTARNMAKDTWPLSRRLGTVTSLCPSPLTSGAHLKHVLLPQIVPSHRTYPSLSRGGLPNRIEADDSPLGKESMVNINN